MTTTTDIHALMNEASTHGDLAQMAICLVALGASPADGEPGTDLAECRLTRQQAISECARVRDEALAMRDGDDDAR